MKRLNPKTGKPFKHGEIREDGKIFVGYDLAKVVKKTGYYMEVTNDAEMYPFRTALKSARDRARRDKLPFDITADYLRSIATDNCPIFGIPLSWGVYGEGQKNKDNSPSLDKIIPELGYIKHNVVFISDLANRIKQTVTEVELYAVADWLHKKRKEVINAYKDKPTPVPIKDLGKGKYNPAYSFIYGAGAREDCDGAHHHQGESEGQDIGNSSQASGGISMGTGVREMGTSEGLQGSEDHGHTGTTSSGTQDGSRLERYKLGERGLARGQLSFDGF